MYCTSTTESFKSILHLRWWQFEREADIYDPWIQQMVSIKQDQAGCVWKIFVFIYIYIRLTLMDLSNI